MKILALQLKRIGDLVLTTPALRALRHASPETHLTLAVMDETAALLPAISQAQAAIIFGRGRGFAPWQQVLTGGWEVCLDFTGNDRSALIAALSRAPTRAAFASVRHHRWRALAYNRWCDSKVRDVHTAQHYLDLAAQAASAAPSSQPSARDPWENLLPELALPVPAPPRGPYALLHPGTARPEKYWPPDRWRQVATHLREAHDLPAVITCGPHPYERAHASAISDPHSTINHPPDLLALSALVAGAHLVISCDTAVVHLAAAFRVPQIALFGPTNPYHWRPLHERAIVLSAAQPEAPLTAFAPHMKGAAMERISTALVIRAIDSLLALDASPRPAAAEEKKV